MKLRFIKANPSGNTTVFILDPVPKEKYADVSRAVLSYGNVGAEQVGFIIKDENQPNGWRMEMAGGEFCGNASRSFAAWLAMCPNGGAPTGLPQEELDKEIAVSGAGHTLTAHLTRMEEENRCYVTVDMPLPQRGLTGRDPWFGEYSLIIFDGISHLVLWDHEDRPEDVDKAKELLRVVGPLPEAFGLMYYNVKDQTMRPLVYVEDPYTLVWENSCGSGSSALASAMAQRAGKSLQNILVKQPGGELKLDVTWENGGVQKLVLGGVIEFTAVGELYL